MQKPGSSIPQYCFRWDCSLLYVSYCWKGQQLGFFWLARTNLNLVQAPLSQQMVLLSGPRSTWEMCDTWFPTKKELDKWIDQKSHAFAAQENMIPKLSKEQLSQIFLYTDETNLFFCFFPEELYEWLSKLAYSEVTWRLEGPIMWTPELVWCLEASKSNIAWVMDHWVDRTLGNFVTYFVIDRNISYTEAEWRIFKGLRGKYLNSLKTWTKILLCEKRVM